ncbi:MAG: FecR domain-containing protein [Mediterranea sp.]|jgi:ferric-dicitrate binding protein FerR (iron transport regulator)|nr:FecR domain-containing protein [Mediterranea sp.]
MRSYSWTIIKLFARKHYSRPTRQAFYRWLTNGHDEASKEEALRKLWERTHATRRQPTRRRIPLRAWQAAAAACFLLALSAVTLLLLDKPDDGSLTRIQVPTGEIRCLVLPDGSEVTMNAQSTLVYATRFGGRERSVFLEGEALFKVKPDKKRPFVVKADEWQITALGTAFNVSAYASAPSVTAMLLSGSILVERERPFTQTMLKPGEQLVYDKAKGRDQLLRPRPDDVTGWCRGTLIFRYATLPDIFRTLERHYDCHFAYNPHELPADRYDFTFHKGTTLADIADIISGVTGTLRLDLRQDSCQVTVK